MVGLLLLAGSASGQDQYDSVAKQYHLLFLPVIARSIETNWSFGVASSLTFHVDRKDTLSRTSNLQGLALYSLDHQAVFVLNGTVYLPGEKYILSQQTSYSSFPDKFWGLGNNTSNSNEESYKFKQIYVFLHGQRTLGHHFYLGMRYEYQTVLEVDYKHYGLFDQENILGRDGYHVSGVGLSFTYDTRNHAFVPNKGEFFQLYASKFANYTGSDFTYTNYVGDIRKFWTVFRHQVLAVQLYGFYNTGDVPLRSLASFGGANSMRGYYSGRFRDKNQEFVQAEYRVPVIGRLGVVVFGGFGDVNHRFTDVYIGQLKYSYGGGLRFMLSKSEKLNLRLDYGIGEQSSGFYFQLGEAF
jgi:outer membrane protein assembly factor BamA